MSDHAPVSLTSGVPETVLPEADEGAVRALAGAEQLPAGERRPALAAVAAADPAFLAAWAALAEDRLGGPATVGGGPAGEDAVAAYAYARVGYHRGLDALRRAGWRGSGFVRWSRPSNRGFLRSLDCLRRAAGLMGEGEEEQRCLLFLHQLDPDWNAR